jgi:hypothetical protein
MPAARRPGRSGWRLSEARAWWIRGLRLARPAPARPPVPARLPARPPAWWVARHWRWPQWGHPASCLKFREFRVQRYLPAHCWRIRWVGPDGVRLAWCARLQFGRGAADPWLGTWWLPLNAFEVSCRVRTRPSGRRSGFTPRTWKSPGTCGSPASAAGLADSGVRQSSASFRKRPSGDTGRPTTVHEQESKVTLM